MNEDFWSGKRVFLTGHSGFKGGWLSLWLKQLGAEVFGYSLPAPTVPSLFDVAQIEKILSGHTIGDVRDPDALIAAIQFAKPDIIFHLAAQPLVRYSYAEPVETFGVNVMGTVNLLEAARKVSSVRALVNVTTDKCYENREWPWGYREGEALGGHDPYSASKACSEIVTASYRSSFAEDCDLRIASGRAGNVIGGGDWAEDRLLPDIFRAAEKGKVVMVRNPDAIRPWQHVLEPLSGYLVLAEKLFSKGSEFADAWNFGPVDNDAKPVSWILDTLCSLQPDLTWQVDDNPAVHEAHYLKLDSSRARSQLGWSSRWSLLEALEKTAAWHKARHSGANMQQFSLEQIADYERSMLDG